MPEGSQANRDIESSEGIVWRSVGEGEKGASGNRLGRNQDAYDRFSRVVETPLMVIAIL
jgi:hypothetical protein